MLGKSLVMTSLALYGHSETCMILFMIIRFVIIKQNAFVLEALCEFYTFVIFYFVQGCQFNILKKKKMLVVKLHVVWTLSI